MQSIARAALALLLFASLAALAATAPMPRVDQLIARNIQARGGMQKIRAIQSLRSSGHILIGPMTLALTIENPRDAFRSDTSINGTTKTEVFDGSRGWVLDPFTKGADAKAEPMSVDQLKQIELQMDFDGPLVDYRKKGSRISLLGIRTFKGVEAYALKIALKNGDMLTMLIDTKHYMEIGDINNAVSLGKTVEVETTLGDYRAVNGVLFPFDIAIKPTGQPAGLRIKLDDVRTNTVIDRARFVMPPMAPSTAGGEGGTHSGLFRK